MAVEDSSVTDPVIVSIVFLCRKLLSLAKTSTVFKKKTSLFIIAAKFAFIQFQVFFR